MHGVAMHTQHAGHTHLTITSLHAMLARAFTTFMRAAAAPPALPTSETAAT